jgi:hypothetical protein
MNPDRAASALAAIAGTPSPRVLPHNLDLVEDDRSDIVTDATIADLRSIWWRLARRGVRLPAEMGVIDMTAGGPT